MCDWKTCLYTWRSMTYLWPIQYGTTTLARETFFQTFSIISIHESINNGPTFFYLFNRFIHVVPIVNISTTCYNDYRYWKLPLHVPSSCSHHFTCRGAFCQFPFRWIYYCHSSKSTGKKTGKTNLCALVVYSNMCNRISMLKILYIMRTIWWGKWSYKKQWSSNYFLFFHSNPQWNGMEMEYLIYPLLITIMIWAFNWFIS